MESAHELMERVRADAEGTPYTVVEKPYGFDLTVDLADARWLTLTAAHGLKRVFTHEVHVKKPGRYGITDIDNEVSYGGGAGPAGVRLAAAKKVSRGRVLSYQRRVELGVDARTGKLGKVVDYSFRAGEGRDLVRRAATDLGWKEQMNGEQLGALWFGGITLVLLVVVFGAIGIHALLT
ncbi:hypothetical protein [Intrasporangium flavum]|uniref:hypothetical protein n=1 Tax=Intrasporangium flavum TaxID=1428657 RepID=UPI001A976970|nr:hypothetical protein [Intrasporangium flavum]